MSIHPGTPRRRYAIITPSHAPDFERCRVLVESTRLHAAALDHYIVVEHRDERLFAELRGPRTHVVVKQDILPWWLHQIPLRPKLWLNLKGPPVRAWIVQQVVRLSANAITDADGCVFIDSDAFLIKPFLAALRELRGQMQSEHIGVMISSKSSTAVESIRCAFEIAA